VDGSAISADAAVDADRAMRPDAARSIGAGRTGDGVGFGDLNGE
jgi:hypothetical protein